MFQMAVLVDTSSGEVNFSSMLNPNMTWLSENQTAYSIDSDIREFLKFQRYVSIIIPIIFSLIVAFGLAGNVLVIVVICINQQMRSTTNILILNLAVADLLFIIICVPFTAAFYVLPQWPFGIVWCKIFQYMIYVCAYASVYTLVLMSLDRYLAVVHPIHSIPYRTQQNTMWILLCLWGVILCGHTPLLFHSNVLNYVTNNENFSACLNLKTVTDQQASKIFYGSLFVCGYVLPLSLIVVLYGVMLKRLLYGVVPGGSQRAESIRSKTRVTKMVVIVVVIFALCWLPIHIVFIIQNFGSYHNSVSYLAIQMVSNCLAYMNSCVNPILYAFLSNNFRQSFKKVLCCGYRHT